MWPFFNGRIFLFQRDHSDCNSKAGLEARNNGFERPAEKKPLV